MVELREKRYRFIRFKISPVDHLRIMRRLLPDMHHQQPHGPVEVNCNLPERIAWLIEKKVGEGQITAVAKIFLYQFSHRQETFELWKLKDTNKVNQLTKTFLEKFSVGKAGIIALEPV